MLILLPPSETKRSGGLQNIASSDISYAHQLGEVREAVKAALIDVSHDEDAAVQALKLGKKNRGEREYNLSLDASGTMPAIERYTGVLYDSLGALEMTSRARAWVDAHVAIQSALFGLIHAVDVIPAYRVSASSRLPKLGKPLHRLWAQAHYGLLQHTSYALDLRSNDYAALAPLDTLGATQFDVVEVVARGEDGEVRALNHFNKAAKGELVKKLAETSANITSRSDLLAWSEAEGIEITVGDGQGRLRLVTKQAVASATR